jgi:hypothetical protein
MLKIKGIKFANVNVLVERLNELSYGNMYPLYTHSIMVHGFGHPYPTHTFSIFHIL